MVCEWVGIYFEIKEVDYFFKPSVMIMMSLFYYLKIKSTGECFDYFILFGFIMSLAGDSFLMLKGSTWFMAGLGSFAFAHILFIFACI